MAMSDWTIVTRSLQARLFSTALTVLTVAVAVCLLLTILTMRNSGRRAFERGAGDMHLLVSAEQSPLVSVLNNLFYANPPRRYLTWERFEQLKKEAPWAYTVPLSLGDSLGQYPIVATTPEYFTIAKPDVGEAWRLRIGKIFSQDFEVVLGATVADTTGLSIGDTIYPSHGISQREESATHASTHVTKHDGEDHDHDDAAPEQELVDGITHIHRDFPCKIVGLLGPTGGSADRAVFLSIGTNWLMHAHDRRQRENPAARKPTMSDLLDEDKKLTAVMLRLQSPGGSETPAALPVFFDKLRKDPTIMVASPRQEIGNLFKIVDNANRVFLAIAGAVFLSSGVAIMLALYNSMQTRQRQLAVLRVLGASSGRIVRLAITESAIIGLAGALIGLVLGLAGAAFASEMVQARLGVIIEPRLAWQHVLIVTVGAVVLACLAGIVPALMAYRVSVSQNLKPAL